MNYLYDSQGDRHLYLAVEEFMQLYEVTRQSVLNWIQHGMPYCHLGNIQGNMRSGLILVPWIAGRDWIWANCGWSPTYSPQELE